MACPRRNQRLSPSLALCSSGFQLVKAPRLDAHLMEDSARLVDEILRCVELNNCGTSGTVSCDSSVNFRSCLLCPVSITMIRS